MKQHSEGWTFIIGTPKYHYMRVQNGRLASLCRKWMVLGTPGDMNPEGSNRKDCVGCRRKLEKEKAAHAEVQS